MNSGRAAAEWEQRWRERYAATGRAPDAPLPPALQRVGVTVDICRVLPVFYRVIRALPPRVERPPW